jgi:putative ABC transport system permease protein
LKKKLISGKVTESGIYIGYRLAEKLKVKQGEELLLAAKTSEGGLNGIKLKIEGVFSFGMNYDKKFFYINLKDARKLLKIYNGTTEIYIFAHEFGLIDKINTEVQKILPAGIIVQTFQEQLGDLYSTMEKSKSIYAFIEFLILFLASFVIINTMMMAIFERLREIGTLKALGMTDRELFLNFTCEGMIIGAIGGLLGATVGFLIIFTLSKQGIDMTSQMKSIDWPIEHIFKPKVEFIDLVVAALISIVVPALSAMIPARYARKLMPAEALRK